MVFSFFCRVLRNMTESKGIRNSRSKVLPCKPGVDPEGNSKAVVIKHIPFGFFEKELLNYFLQFGTVQRVRVARNKKVCLFFTTKKFQFILFNFVCFSRQNQNAHSQIEHISAYSWKSIDLMTVEEFPRFP